MKKSCRFAAFVCLILATHSVSAAWSLEPSYYLRAERNDNIYLSQKTDVANHLAVTGGSFSPAIKALMEDENQSLVTDLDLQFTRYKDHEELDRDEGKAGMVWKRATELSLYGVNASYSHKTNLDTTIEASGIDQLVEINTANVAPNWQFQFAENWTVSLSLSYTDVEYDEPGFPGVLGLKVVNFINYTEAGANLSLTHKFSEKSDVSLTYYQSRYEGISNGLQFSDTFFGFIEASERKLDYDYSVMQLGYEYQFEEGTMWSAQVGSSETIVTNQIRDHLFLNGVEQAFSPGPWETTDTQNKGQVYNLSYIEKREISRLELSAGRNRFAASTGGLEETDTVKLYYNSQITELLSWALDLNAEKHRPDDNTNIQSTADYTRINLKPALYYSLNKDWSMSLGYQYSEKDIATDVSPRESNMVYFTMRWRDPKLLSTN